MSKDKERLILRILMSYDKYRERYLSLETEYSYWYKNIKEHKLVPGRRINKTDLKYIPRSKVLEYEDREELSNFLEEQSLTKLCSLENEITLYNENYVVVTMTEKVKEWKIKISIKEKKDDQDRRKKGKE